METASKYRFLERSDGFIVEASQRMPVRVELCDTGFRVQLHRPRQLCLLPELEQIETQCRAAEPPDVNLLQYRKLVDLVTSGVMSRWKPTKLQAPDWRIEAWARQQTRRALQGRIFDQWRRLTAKADPQIYQVQKAVFAVCLRDVDLLHEEAFYEDKYLVRDIQHYRAAAAIVPIARDLVASQREQTDFGDEHTTAFDVGDNPETHGDNELYVAQEDDEERCSLDNVLHKLADWQGLYSRTGMPYRSLRRTLMKLPGGIPCGLLYELHRLRLVRPMTNRLELACLLLSSSERPEDDSRVSPNQRFFHHTRAPQLREGLARVSEDWQFPLSHRRTGDLARFVRYLLDYPEEHRGTFRGLVRAAVEWHHADYNVADWEREFGPSKSSYDDSTPTKVPRIPLPKIAGVYFLPTAGAIRSEGKRMQHCVGSYVDSAVQGKCFLFHVEYQGDQATVELSPTGSVRQACGPKNQPNRATEYAEVVLRKWGKGLAGPKPSDTSRRATGIQAVVTRE
ncbi:MAG: PcfJ domain-containing protein [bacterium]|nr:PcfJ domain-containing protein [bacterium]